MSAKSVCDMSCGQMHEFAISLDKAGFNADLIQDVVNSRGNKLAEAMCTVANVALKEEATLFDTPIVRPDPIIVPDDFDHRICLTAFRTECEKQFGHFNPDSTDKNFAKATVKLTPGRKFRLKLIPIKKGKVVSSDDCLARLKQEKAVLTSAQGLTLVYRQAKDKLSRGKYYPCFDEQENLPVVDGYRRVPYLGVCSDGVFYWDLGDFADSWNGGVVLVCLCDWDGPSA